MTTVTMAPAAAEASGANTERSVRHPQSLVGDVRPRVNGARPTVRRIRPAVVAGEADGRSTRRPAGAHAPRPVPCDRSYEPDMHGSRLTWRGKIVVAAIWMVFAAAIVFMVSRPADVPVPSGTTTVVVESGDTLWGIARGLAPSVDTRVTVAQIIELNGLRSAGDIHPGDVLVIPLASE